jgi:hypothetical protein
MTLPSANTSNLFHHFVHRTHTIDDAAANFLLTAIVTQEQQNTALLSQLPHPV